MPKHKVRRRTTYAYPEDYIKGQVIVTKAGCWEWPGTPRGGGYPCTRVRGVTVYLARYSYELFRGPIPDGLHVLHTCDNPPCVNPEHLFLGTHQENVIDMNRKGRGPAKFGPEQIKEVVERANNGESRKSLAREYGVCRKTIKKILTGKCWNWVETEERPGPGICFQILTEMKVREIKSLLGVMPYTQIALKFGVSRRCIYDIRNGKTWKGVE